MRRTRGNIFWGWIARAILAGAIAAVCSPLFAAIQASGDPATILVVRFGGDLTQTRVVIESDRPLSTRLAPPDGDPRHVVLYLPGAIPKSSDVGDGSRGATGLVKSWRLRAAVGGARLLLDLSQTGRISHRFALPPSAPGKTYRYVVDVSRSDPPWPEDALTASLAEASATQHVAPVARTMSGGGNGTRALASAAPVKAVKVAAMRRVRKVIVVDAGHGGHDPGAQAANLDEKDITLATALALRKRLERGGRYKVVMTRDTDVFIPLPTRVQIARHAGADLFISLHADSAASDSDTHGASVYTLSDHGETRVSEVLGHGEWFTQPGDRGGDPAVGSILLDLTQRSTLNRSALFAGLLIDRVGDKIDLLPRTHRDAGYFVLLAPDVPAVLLEMGFISSPRDQGRLTDPSERTKLTNAIADAIDAYFDSQPEPAPAARKTKPVVQAHAIKPPLQLPATQAG